MKQRDFYIRLKLKRGIGYKGMNEVMDTLGDCPEITASLIQEADLPDKLKNLVITAYKSNKLGKLVERILLQCDVLTFFDDIYPIQLKQMYQPPLILFARGNLNLLSRRITVIVGSRNPTSYSTSTLKKLIPNLVKQDFVIASGLAKGVDTIAHEQTLASKGKTIAVVGNGLNYFYPAKNRDLQKQIEKVGLVLSEYLPDTEPIPAYFPQRNRILAGLSENVIVAEARKKSGSLITANIALQENRNIFAIPGPLGSQLAEGPNYLIAAGAQPIVNFDFKDMW